MSNDRENLLIKGILLHGTTVIEHCEIDSATAKKYNDQVELEHLDYPKLFVEIDSSNWLIPESYKTMDIEEFLAELCPKENQKRLLQELELFRKNNMMALLKAMKYLVDTFRNNNIVWGVGRGSSVASYVLYLIGVHKIDPIKYNLPLEEFFKGEKNGEDIYQHER